MNLQQFLPFEKYTLTTKLSETAIRERLANNVQPRRGMFSYAGDRSGRPYEGTMNGNLFTISRIIQHRNSFLPVINGEISSFLGQTEIRIRMGLDGFVKVFIILWLSFAGLACIVTSAVLIAKPAAIFKNDFPIGMLVPFFLFIFGFLLMLLLFKYESKKSRAFLAGLFEAKEEASAR
ncbi:MAG: hypothetical protein QM687_16545 [Ferruginibacter sp.]